MGIKNNISGISAAINEFINCRMPIYDNNQTLPEFSIKVANTLEEREAVFNLAYQVYMEKGYVQKNQNQWLIKEYDFDPNTVVLIVKNQDGIIVGSVTIAFESNFRLPAMSLFQNEIEYIRMPEMKIAEISRLVIDKNYRNSKNILLLLINYLFIYTHHVKEYSRLVIQVNPRHVNFYKTFLCFDEISESRPCSQVQNAPAVLLSVSMSIYQNELIKCSQPNFIGSRYKTLYKNFLKPNQEQLVALYLKKQAKPMTADEKIYFGFAESGFSKAVCVN